MFNNRYWDAIQAAGQVEELFPGTHLGERASSVAIKAFALGARLMAGEQNYKRVVEIWDKQPILQKGEKFLDPETRLLVATSLWKTGRNAEALALSGPLLAGTAGGEIALAAMNLAMNVHLGNQDWKALDELGSEVGGWAMPASQKAQLEFALALADENLGRFKQARARWERLARDMEMPAEQRGYALYYLASAAGKDGRLQDQYLYAQEALALFLEQDQDVGKIKDCLLMLTEVARKAGRLKKALHWAESYHGYIQEDDADWAASYFRQAGVAQWLGQQQDLEVHDAGADREAAQQHVRPHGRFLAQLHQPGAARGRILALSSPISNAADFRPPRTWAMLLAPVTKPGA